MNDVPRGITPTDSGCGAGQGPDRVQAQRGSCRWAAFVMAVCFAGAAPGIRAHGEVMSEDDACVIRIGVFEGHFKLYQPRDRQQEEFCEDLPGAGETVLVMEYLSPALREAPLELRIIRDLDGLKQYARQADVDRIEDLEAVTVFHQPPQVHPDVFTAVFTIDQPGWYIGILTARHPEGHRSYAAVFPIEAGFTGPGYFVPLLLVLALMQLGYWWMNGRLGRWRAGFRARRLGVPADRAPAAVQDAGQRVSPRATAIAWLLPCLLSLAATEARSDETPACVSVQGAFQVSYRSELDPIRINQIHDWVLRVTTPDGKAVSGAQIGITGGMPRHDHGLPTQPVVVELLNGGDYPGDYPGNYRVEGMRFHMPGEWEISISITSGSVRDTCVFVLRL